MTMEAATTATDARRPGRPPGSLRPVRTRVLQVGLSEDERALLEQKARAAGTESLVQYARAALLGVGAVQGRS